MGPGSHLGGGEGPEPYPRRLPRFPDLRHPLAPVPHPYSPISRVLTIEATFASFFPTLIASFLFLEPFSANFGGRSGGDGGNGGGGGGGGRGGLLVTM